jgi:hypothetical protein
VSGRRIDGLTAGQAAHPQPAWRTPRVIDVAALPRSLRWLDVGQNRLAPEVVAELRAALPDCRIESYGQTP